MQKLTIISILLLLSISLFSQSTLKIYSDLKNETSKFMVYINGEPQDAIHMKTAEITDLQAGNIELRVAFNADTIADYVEIIEIPAKATVVYKVARKNKLGRDVGELGRSLGRFFGATEKDETAGLKETYKLIKISK